VTTNAIYSTVASAMTVVSFLVFIAICAWAYSKHRRQPYEDAANAPFAVPDELPTPCAKGHFDE
jgi:cbb3-type cytochrome oxidase subunit 3